MDSGDEERNMVAFRDRVKLPKHTKRLPKSVEPWD